MDTDQFPQNAPGAGSFKVSPIAVLRNIVRFFVFWKDAVEDFLDNDCQYIASAIAFYALFSMFPLFLAVIVVVGFVLGEDARDTQLALTREVGSILPVSGSLVRQTVEQVVRTHLATGILSFVGLLWASTAAFGAIRKGINAAWGIKETRQFFKKRFIDFILVLGAGLIVFILLFVSPAAGALRQAAQEAAPETIWATSAFWNIITRVVSPILVFVSILLLYRFMPHTKVTLGGVWLPALGASLALGGLSLGFVWYINKFSLYGSLYGSIGSLLALLMWVYLSAIILLFGALLAARFHGYSEDQLQRLMRLKRILDRVKLDA